MSDGSTDRVIVVVTPFVEDTKETERVSSTLLPPSSVPSTPLAFDVSFPDEKTIRVGYGKSAFFADIGDNQSSRNLYQMISDISCEEQYSNTRETLEMINRFCCLKQSTEFMEEPIIDKAPTLWSLHCEIEMLKNDIKWLKQDRSETKAELARYVQESSAVNLRIIDLVRTLTLALNKVSDTTKMLADNDKKLVGVIKQSRSQTESDK